jgi:hypothetical protein
VGLPGGLLTRLLAAGAGAVVVGVGIHLALAELHPWIIALGTLVPFAGVYLAATLVLGVGQPLRSLLRR